MNRFFEKISFLQFKKDIIDDQKLYDEYLLPSRKTKDSAGYDFIAIKDYVLTPGETVIIPTGIKAKFNPGEALILLVRSSMGFKYNIRMCNQVGLIDADYYNNVENEGHIFVALKNEGEKEYQINKGDAYVQGVFINYLTVGDEINATRLGGIGSTDKIGRNEI